MSLVIKDGKSGTTATVDSRNRLLTFATSESAQTIATLNGDTYTVNTDVINLTSANASAILHLANTDTVDWVLTRIFVNIAASTGGTGELAIEVISNATAGTLISGGSTVTPRNLNFGSPKLLSSTVLSGVEGSTVTDGISVIDTIVPTDNTRFLITGDSVVLEPASQASIRVTPPSGNTSLNVQAGFVLHRVVE